MFYIRFRKHTRLNDCFIIPDKFGAAMALVKSDIGGNITVRILLLCVIMLHVDGNSKRIFNINSDL